MISFIAMKNRGWVGYSLAVLTCGLALFSKLLMGATLGSLTPFLLFVAAVAVSAWYGGFGPGLLATAISGVVSVFLFLPRSGTWFGSAQSLQLVLFLAECLLITYLSGSRRQARIALQGQTQLLEKINQITLSLAEAPDLPGLLQVVVDSGCSLTGARYGAFLCDPEPMGECRVGALDGLGRLPLHERADFPLSPASPLLASTYREGKTRRISDITRSDPHKGGLPVTCSEEGSSPVRSYLALPVKSRSGEVLGGLFFGHPRAGCFDVHAERLIAGIAAQTAIAIENALLYREAQNELAERRRVEDALRAADRLKDDFVATLSHELRTPLNAILGWSRMLRHKELDPRSAARALEIIERNARSQAQLIDDTLDVSRIVTGKLKIEVVRVDLAAVIEAATDALSPAAEAKKLELVHDIDLESGQVWGDAERLQQVIWNLLSNAIKFTPSGGRVFVRLKTVEETAEISVADTGQGIDPQFLPFVFDRFRQSDSTSKRTQGGLGLGLAIVRHLVELHGGSVRAESSGEGKGSTFTVSLPKRAAPGPPPSFPLDRNRKTARLPCDENPDLNDVRVVVVEDHADTRDLLTFLLERCGCVVRACSSAAEALRAVQEWTPDVLVADIGMPGEDGYELIRKIRLLEPAGGGHTPAIAVTAYARNEDREKALEAGFQDHVAKPLEPFELISAVAALTGRTLTTTGDPA